MLRDMKDYKSRVESYSREMLRKDSQIKELQGRIETGDGCKYYITFHLTTSYLLTLIKQWLFSSYILRLNSIFKSDFSR